MMLVGTAQLAIAVPHMQPAPLNAHEPDGSIDWDAAETALTQLPYPAHVVQEGMLTLKDLMAQSEEERVISEGVKTIKIVNWKTAACKATSEAFNKVRLQWQHVHNMKSEADSHNTVAFNAMCSSWKHMTQCDEAQTGVVQSLQDERQDAVKALTQLKFPADVVEAGVEALSELMQQSEEEKVSTADVSAKTATWHTAACKAASEAFEVLRKKWQQKHNLKKEADSQNKAAFLTMGTHWTHMVDCNNNQIDESVTGGQ